MKPAFGATVPRLANQIARGAATAGKPVGAGAAAPHRLHLGEPVDDWGDVEADELAAIGADRHQPAAARARAPISRARRGLQVDHSDAVAVLRRTIGHDTTFDDSLTAAERGGFGLHGRRRERPDGEPPTLREELFDHPDLPTQVAAALAAGTDGPTVRAGTRRRR